MMQSARKILVIQNDTKTRNMYLDSLATEGFETIAAENGVIGIQEAQAHLPDLILCDIFMPLVDGYGVLDTLREDPVTAIIPFIFISGSGTKTDFRKAMDGGADDYLTEPFTVEELLNAIAHQLQKRIALLDYYASEFESAFKLEQTAIANPKFSFPCVPQLKKVFDFIEAHYHQGISLCDVAEAVGYSPAYLTNQVGKLTGETVNRWIVKRRMIAACLLLQTKNQTIEEIATSLGYQNPCHFSRQFRQHYGFPPQVWRSKVHQAVDV
ncbi:response regulator transcription factor [Scytonema hofmannii FACHB-248]|uniref:Response regulator transcription factor n=1 Tax=Scytonema hofmannii FACHB-248 TaxID=1842502 RepID=A0ABR8GSH9_9CYAN|nr:MULTISPECIES: response regulator transcription factor [Nostocales]MBD2606424.1 response regulator transcription factor [Scytonema hofmannii FACHB-248]